MRTLRDRLSHLRRDDGMTIVEVLVVILIIGIIGMVGLDIISSTTNATVRASEQYLKLGNADRAVSFLQARIGGIDDAVGTDTSTGIDRLSIARDQIVFVESSTGGDACVRVFYEKAQARLRAKVVVPDGTSVTSPCTDPAIKPVRGPNQPPAGSSTPGAKAAPGASDFDPAQDLGPGQQATVAGKTYTGAIELATNLVSQRPSSASADLPDPLSLFTFRDASDQPMAAGGGLGPDEEASSGGPANAWYADKTNRKKITAVDVVLYLNAPKSQPMTAPLARKATIYVGGGRSKSSARASSTANPNSVLAYNSQNQYVYSGGVNDGPLTILNLDSEVVDSSAMHSTAVGNNQLVVQVGGLYMIDASFNLTSSIGNVPTGYGSGWGSTAIGYVLRNGSAIYSAPIPQGGTSFGVTGLTLNLVAGDVIQLAARACTGQGDVCSPASYGPNSDGVASRYVAAGSANNPSNTKLAVKPW